MGVIFNNISLIINKKNIDAIYAPERKGDVKHSKASIKKSETNLCYIPEIKFKKQVLN